MKTPDTIRSSLSIVVVTCLLGALLPAAGATPNRIRLSHLGTYASGQFDAGAAEIVAHDPATQTLLVVNAQAAEVDVISIRNPAAPVKVGSIDVKPFGAVANSVAVHNGVLAVAVENAVKTSPGKAVFFDRNLNFLAQVEVGALPDMITFSPNGRHVLVANEAEPNNTYTIDPEGSVSIIDLTGGVKNLNPSKVRTADFRAFNQAPLDPSIRIFGPGATVAQDLEPEYITISHDSRTAWVTCQENNAIAIVDIPSASVLRLVGLGFKDHAAADALASRYDFDPSRLPPIGTTLAGQEIQLGGFSGLAFEGIDNLTGHYRFVSHTDRGPNAEPVGLIRPFLLQDFAPRIIRFELDPASRELFLEQQIILQSAPGVPLTGLPNTQINPSANTPHNDEVPVDLLGNLLPLDPLGADLEGIVVDPSDGSFWMCDEYRPALCHFDANGVLLKRFVPTGAAAAAGLPAGSLGDEVLPSVLGQRRQNRGFEGLALDNGKLYAFVQSPLRNPASTSNATLNNLRNVRLLEFDPATQSTRMFLYVMDNPSLGGADNTRADKIGDAASLGNGEFLVIERDDDKSPADAPEKIEKKVYQFNLTGATDITGKDGLIGTTGKTVDQLPVPELVANGIRPIEKVLYVDLAAAGYDRVEKVEGLAVIDPWTIAVVNDNDFGVANITIHPDGSFERNYIPEPTQLGLINVRHNALDASDRDGKINIRPWPVKGIYLPDAIASFQVGGRTYLVTANEGDAREYLAEDPATGEEISVFVEAVRVGSGSVTLDPARFPNPAVLKNNANLGRLNITSTLGRNASTGFYETLYAFGGRSFSILDDTGALLWDSGDDLERLTARELPANFNASNSNNDFDNRSDDKGPEPEGVALGKINGNDYAFVGLERIGGIVVYDISNPASPRFVDYVNMRDFTQPVDGPLAGDLGPEGLLFIPAGASPNGKPLLVIGNEISGTTTLLQIDPEPGVRH